MQCTSGQRPKIRGFPQMRMRRQMRNSTISLQKRREQTPSDSLLTRGHRTRTARTTTPLKQRSWEPCPGNRAPTGQRLKSRIPNGTLVNLGAPIVQRCSLNDDSEVGQSIPELSTISKSLAPLGVAARATSLCRICELSLKNLYRGRGHDMLREPVVNMDKTE